MSKLIINVEETHAHGMDGSPCATGIAINYHFEDLEHGDMLPGLAPLLLRLVKQGIDMNLGDRISIEDDYELPSPDPIIH